MIKKVFVDDVDFTSELEVFINEKDMLCLAIEDPTMVQYNYERILLSKESAIVLHGELTRLINEM